MMARPASRVVAVDVETGEEVVFDTRNERIGVEHLLASAALIPDFQPVKINGRVLVDGGLADNVPVDVVLSEPPDLPLTCFALDLFPTHALPPSHLLQAAQRQTDLMFANQTRRSLRDQQEIWRLRGPGHPASVHWLEYRGTSDEIAMKSYDFSGAILKRRWHIGEQDMRAALRTWRETTYEAVRADGVSARAASGCIRSERQYSPAVWLRVSDLLLMHPFVFVFLQQNSVLRRRMRRSCTGEGCINAPGASKASGGAERTQQFEELNGTERER